MTFRKDSILFYQNEIFYVLMAMLCLASSSILEIGISLVCMFSFIVLMIINPKLHNEFIVIDETGISCQKSGIQLWAYEWNDIAELKKSSRFLMPSIEVITYNKRGEKEEFSSSNHYFQMGKTAKKAIEQYYKRAQNF